jgi:hypothetical protein
MMNFFNFNKQQRVFRVFGKRRADIEGLGQDRDARLPEPHSDHQNPLLEHELDCG